MMFDSEKLWLDKLRCLVTTLYIYQYVDDKVMSAAMDLILKQVPPTPQKRRAYSMSVEVILQ
jgi:hypothetical protein